MDQGIVELDAVVGHEVAVEEYAAAAPTGIANRAFHNAVRGSSVPQDGVGQLAAGLHENIATKLDLVFERQNAHKVEADCG
jgi:hypothetical protein